jgi:V8-like Glu-specific endopeptidase
MRSSNSADFPLRLEELRRTFKAEEAKETPPKELRSLWSDLSVRKKAEVVRIPKSAEPADPIQAYRPPWMAHRLIPKRAEELAPPQVRHRSGVHLDPRIIWQPDDRIAYDDTSYPWGLVCRIFSRGQGSGVIVGPRHVLTASHVINWQNPSATIEVNRVATGHVQAVAQATRIWWFTQVDQIEYSTLDEDYVVLVTDQRIGDRFGWMGVRTYDSRWDGDHVWANIGYAGDVAQAQNPMRQFSQALDEEAFDYGGGRDMTTTADLNHGQSGGPMFANFGNPPMPYAVAVVSAQGAMLPLPWGRENWCSGGNDMTRLVNYARSQDP